MSTQLEPVRALTAEQHRTSTLNIAPTFWTLLRALKRRWFIAFFIGLICAGAAASAVWMLVPLTHTVRSLLHVRAVQPRILFDADDRFNFQIDQRTQAALLKSRFSLNVSLKQPEVAQLKFVRDELDPIGKLESRLKVEFTASPEIMSVSLDGDDPAELVIIVNAVTKGYLEEFVNKEHRSNLARLEELKKLHRDCDDRIQTKRKTLQELARNVGAGNEHALAIKQQIAAQRLVLAKKELTEVHSEMRKIQVTLAAANARQLAAWPGHLLYCSPKAGLAANLVVAAVMSAHAPAEIEDIRALIADKDIEDDVLLQQLHKRKSELESLIDAIQRVAPAGAAPSEIEAQQNQLQLVLEGIEARRDEVRHELAKELRHRQDRQAQANVVELKVRLKTLKEFDVALNDDVQRLAKDARALVDGEIDLASLRSEISSAEVLTGKISRAIEALQVEQNAPRRVALLEEAAAYPAEGLKKKIMMTGMAGAGVLALILLGFARLEFGRRRVDSTEEVSTGLGLRLVGTIPDFSYRHHSALLNADESLWETMLMDSIDATRTMMLSLNGQLKTLLITSADSGEGKTATASHLAASLARTGRKTLLLDCDFRNSGIHRIFDTPRTPGLCDVLRGEKSVAEVIQPLTETFSLINAGDGDARAVQALGQGRLRELLEIIHQEYEFVVIDSAPVLPVPDSLWLAQHADGVVFCVLRGVSRMPQLCAAYDRLKLVGANILGVIVNGVRSETYAKSKRYYYLGQNRV